MIDGEEQSVSDEASADAVAREIDEPVRKPRATRTRKAAGAKPAGLKLRRHGPQERAEKLAAIDERLAKGDVSLKAAVAEAGISDQTYYQWKRAVKPAEDAPAVAAPQPAAASVGNELADLIKLDQENQRLRQLLAEKLRAENAELRRRLDLD